MRNKIQSEYIPSVRGNTGMDHSAMNSIISGEKKADEARHLGLTRDTRATVDQVLDPRTILVLTKFLKNGVLNEIFGCISTGKEANVYYAQKKGRDEEIIDRAVKVYKTSILVFKDRARYVEGEFRFRRGYCKSNPRRMVAQWCEKEMRNLKRIRQSSDIKVPEPLEIRQNVLVMEFIGHDSVAAPRLKDAVLPDSEWPRVYTDTIIMLRKLFQQCKLVHGDLSEYNMLWHDDEIVVIDVSQSVECDHVHALDFLKRDCININIFFEKKGCRTVALRALFDFTTLKEKVDVNELLTREYNGVDDEVFKNTWIPSSLQQVQDLMFIEKELAKHGRGESVLCMSLLANEKDRECTDEESDDDESSQSDSSENDAEDIEDREDDKDDEHAATDKETKGKKGDGHIPADVSKADWKKMVKELRREKLKDKIPKSCKKKHRKEAASRK
eukprot:GEMP01044631.1.p1 GENE.GEMP01044631.1~~GEMP01044631.1.p1  ORF type:complete len:496 (+),score=99.40 GEMP01044631.1:162-1490(+)